MNRLIPVLIIWFIGSYISQAVKKNAKKKNASKNKQRTKQSEYKKSATGKQSPSQVQGKKSGGFDFLSEIEQKLNEAADQFDSMGTGKSGKKKRSSRADKSAKEKKQASSGSQEGHTYEGYSMHKRGHDAEDEVVDKVERAKSEFEEQIEVADEMQLHIIGDKPSEALAGPTILSELGTDREELAKAILYAEIIGAPVSMRD